MRIAMIGHKQMEGCEGGIEKTVRELSARLAERGHAVTVYDRNVLFSGNGDADTVREGRRKARCRTEDGHGKKPGAGNAAGVRNAAADKQWAGSVTVRRVPTLPGAAEVPLYALLACLRAAFSRADVIMIHASGPCVMIPAAKLTGKKAVAFIHGLDSHSSKWGRFAKWYLARGERRAAKSADALLLLSEHIRDHFRTTYGRGGTLVLNGVSVLPADPDSAAADAEILRARGLADGGYVLWVGRISREKGLTQLLCAWEGCHAAEKLVLAGAVDPADPYYRELRQQSSGEERVVFAGYQTQRELAALYRHAKLFVFPSEQEGMPHALLEALAYGAPCLLSEIPENRAVAGRHAVYFAPDDAEELRERLQVLLDDPALREAVSHEAASDTLKRFSWERAADRIETVCRHVLRKRR